MKKLNDFVIIGLLILFVGISGLALYWVWNQEKMCVHDPLGYGIRKVSVSTNKPIVCTCISPNTEPYIFDFRPEYCMGNDTRC